MGGTRCKGDSLSDVLHKPFSSFSSSHCLISASVRSFRVWDKRNVSIHILRSCCVASLLGSAVYWRWKAWKKVRIRFCTSSPDHATRVETGSGLLEWALELQYLLDCSQKEHKGSDIYGPKFPKLCFLQTLVKLSILCLAAKITRIWNQTRQNSVRVEWRALLEQRWELELQLVLPLIRLSLLLAVWSASGVVRKKLCLFGLRRADSLLRRSPPCKPLWKRPQISGSVLFYCLFLLSAYNDISFIRFLVNS